MSLNDIEQSLPNGFHDSKINAIYRNLKTETVKLYLDILVGLPDDEPARQRGYRQGILTFEGVKIFISEEPSVESKFSDAGSLNFAISEGEVESVSQGIMKMINQECHIYTLFVQEWFSNLIVVADKIEFSWAD